MSCTVITPCAGPIDPNGPRPHWLLTTPSGDLAITRAIASIPQNEIGRVVIGLSREADRCFGAATAIRRSFEQRGLGEPSIVVLDEPTAGPAHTVHEIIRHTDIAGPIVIKDSDSIFDCGANLPAGSFVAVTDLREHLDITNVGEKSFVLCNEQGFIDNIVEKEVCSNLISVGLYGFSDVAIFRQNFQRACGGAPDTPALFVSHVVAAAIDRGELFAPFKTTNFVEVDSKPSWRAYCERQMTLVLDLDGVVFESRSGFFPPYWDEEDKPIAANVAYLRQLQATGAQFVFMTARPDKYRQKTLAALRAAGLDVHALITGCHHARRYLVNDFAPSNPFPTAIAVNMARDAPDLPKLIRPANE